MNKHFSYKLKTFFVTLALLYPAFTAQALPPERTVRIDRVQAFDVNVYELEVQVGEEVYIVVVGDGDTDLDLYIVDEHENIIASDTDLTDYCVATITSARSGRFYIVIENLGDVYNEYEMTIERTPLQLGGTTVQSAGLVLQGSSGETEGLPIEHVDRVLPYDMDVYEVTLEAGVLVSVTVVGDGDTDLDLYIVDESGNLIASDTGETDLCLAMLVPDHTGPYYIVVDNLGDVYNLYTIRIE